MDDVDQGLQERDRLERLGREWMKRIRAQQEREKAWCDDAREAERDYLVDEENGDAPRFNILHSNVETIVPSTYNSTPSPDIRPRHNAGDPMAKVVCDILERAIATQIDDERLDTEIEATAQDSFLAGRGITRIKYEADLQEEVLTGERVVYENVSWRDYCEGPAKRWRDVPWVAYREHVFADQLDGMRDTLTVPDRSDEDDESRKGGVDLWQIWDKQTRQVITIASDKSEVIRIDDDPLGLPGFFPQPEPVQPISGTGRRTPVCPYSVYKYLAKELDTQTRRINKITEGLKLRGLFGGDVDVMDVLSQAEDNELVHKEELKSAMATSKLDDLISWWPVDKAIVVLRELMAQREGTKQAIYEITGISDIVRGASNSKETATAQQIKTQWGSLRIKRLQNMIARHVRDLFILTAEVMGRQFEPQSVLRAAGMLQDQNALQVVDQLSRIDHYRIDIESDSTVRADLTQKRGEMSEFLGGTAQFFNTMAPILQQAPQAAGPAIEMYAAFARQFSLGKQAEDALDQMVQMAQQVDPQESQPDPIKMGELEVKKGELGVKQQKTRIDAFKAENDAQHKQAEIMLEADQRRAVGIG
jgi:hypothetical protein